MSDRPAPLDRLEFDLTQLAHDHPPVLHHPHKRLVHEIACPPGFTPSGRIEYSRWATMPLPDHVHSGAVAHRMTDQPGYFDYRPASDVAGAVDWHVNFADPSLFLAYGSGLFAQDEMQTAEHPALGSLREALLARGLPAVTVERNGPTPVLVRGVPRLCHVATDPNVAEGRPGGLYGNAFARADPDAVRRATTRIDPPTITNLIAMAAPAGGHGPYRADEIEKVLATAYTAFHAAVEESFRARVGPGPGVVHTGFWGCGAFGGHRVLMTLLQAISGQVAGVDRIVFHTGDPSGAACLLETRRLLRHDLREDSPLPVHDLIGRIAEVGFEWGVSDGN